MRNIIILFSVLLFMAGDTTISYAVTGDEFVANCRQTIRDLEHRAAATTDAYQKAAIYREAGDTGFRCLRQGPEQFPDADAVYRLGSNEFRETSNYLSYCKFSIAQKEIDMRPQPAMKHFAMLGDLMDFSFGCLKTFTSELHDPSIAPKLGSDELRETTNLVQHCQLIIDKLKSQYDPIHCEPADVNRRDEVVSNLKKVETWCIKAWSSEAHDSSVPGPRFAYDDYGTEDLYINPVCGIVPDSEDSGETDSGVDIKEIGRIGYAETDCLEIMRSLADQGTSWTAEKNMLTTKDDDYCLLVNTSHVYPNGLVDEELIQERLKITFTGSGDPRGEKLIAELKAAEDPDFHIDSEYMYWGFTERIGRNYFRQVENIFPYCVLDSSVEFIIPPLPEGDDDNVSEYINYFIGQIGSHQSYNISDMINALKPVCEIGLTSPSKTDKRSGLASSFAVVIVLLGGGGVAAYLKRGIIHTLLTKKR